MYRNCNTADEYLDILLNNLKEMINGYAPELQGSNTKKKHFYPKNIKKLASKKFKFYKKYKHTGDVLFKSKFKKFSKEYDIAFYSYYSAKEFSLCNDANIKLFYDYVNSELHYHPGNSKIDNCDNGIDASNK